MSHTAYNNLVECDMSFSWSCTNCDEQNYSSFANNIDSLVSENSFSVLEDMNRDKITSHLWRFLTKKE